MQIANILSDLTSLRVCDHSAALALVSAREPSSNSKSTSTTTTKAAPHPKLISQDSMAAEEDPDMQRATDLLELHDGVKIKHAQGLDKDLLEARKQVERVMEGLREGRR